MGGVRRPCRNGSSCSDFSEGYIAHLVRVFVDSGIDIIFSTQLTNDYIDILPGEVPNRLRSTVWSIWRSLRETIRVSHICKVFENNTGVRPTAMILFFFENCQHHLPFCTAKPAMLISSLQPQFTTINYHTLLFFFIMTKSKSLLKKFRVMRILAVIVLENKSL